MQRIRQTILIGLVMVSVITGLYPRHNPVPIKPIEIKPVVLSYEPEPAVISDSPPTAQQFATQLSVEATGYTANAESTGKSRGEPSYGQTRSGVMVRRGKVSTIAADLSLFPLGTVINIPGYGIGVVCDIGDDIQGAHLDLYFKTFLDVYNQWGKQDVVITVIEWGDNDWRYDRSGFNRYFNQIVRKYES